MKKYIKYLNETKSFWILTAIVAIFISLYISVLAVKINFPESPLSFTESKWEQLEKGQSMAIFRGISASDILGPESVGSAAFILFAIFAVASIYHFCYRGKSDINALSRLPIQKGNERIYEYITGILEIIIGLLASYIYIVPKAISYNGQIKSCLEQSGLSIKIDAQSFKSASEIFSGFGWLDNLRIYGVIALYLILGMTVIYLFGALVKFIPIGYAVGGFGFFWFSADKLDTYLSCFGNTYMYGESGYFEINVMPILMVMLIIVGFVLFVLALQNQQPEKHRIFNYPIIAVVAGICFIVYVNCQFPIYNVIVAGRYLFGYGVFGAPLGTFILDIAVVIGAIILLKKKKSSTTEVKASKHHGFGVEMIKPYAILLGVMLLAVLLGFLKDFENIDSSINYSINSGIVYNLESGLKYYMNMFFMIYLGFKGIELILKRNTAYSEKYDRFPISRAKKNLFAILLEIIVTAIPLALSTAIVSMMCGSYADGVSLIPSLWKTFFIFCLEVVSAIGIFAFVSHSYNSLLSKAISAISLCAIWHIIADWCKFGFNVKEAVYANMIEFLGYPTLILILSAIAIICLVLSFVVCRKDLSSNAFSYKAAEYILLMTAAAAYALIWFNVITFAWQYILCGAVFIIGIALYFVAKKQKAKNNGR